MLSALALQISPGCYFCSLCTDTLVCLMGITEIAAAMVQGR